MPEIHPNLPQLSRRRVADLQRALTSIPEDRDAAAAILRSLTEKIVVHPGKRRGETTIFVEGSIPAILSFANGRRDQPLSRRSLAMVVPRGGIEPPTP
jgi:site-specific DNA recombinase